MATPSVRQETLQAPTGSIDNFTDAFNTDIGFDTLSIAIDNFTGYWLYVPEAANPYIPPWWAGVVRNLIHSDTRPRVQWASPFGGFQNPTVTGAFANVTFTNYILPYAPGFLAGAPPNPNNPPGPPPINITIDPADITVIAQAICDCMSAPVVTVTCGETVLSSRFVVWDGAQPICTTNCDAIILWDALPEFDEIGFDGDWVNGNFNFTAGMGGDYLVTAYVELDDAASLGGNVSLVIEGQLSNSPFPHLLSDRQMHIVNADFPTNPQISVSGVHRFYDGGSTNIFLRTDGAGDPATFRFATVTLSKLRKFPF